ncbi:ArsR family transcriptional regulator [Psychrobacillus glaciei]|uniref:ArsR family transcriptional regulator n=1 Tax=Psychrobacillus glaciei TaxID=2283160 RepID=A0A5J6SQH0_9BACI|nr:ArsR family transcriptional regulator [Psychrobacillus glaciei]QFG00267.1 ArsR family transcriptional regulator [Psychrobacillus glaciei]
MSILLGLLGPSDSIDVVQHYLKKYNDITSIPIECLTEEDLNQHVLPKKNDITMWLCTGPITYDIVQRWGKISDPIFYIPFHGSAIYSLLLQLSHEHHVKVNEISYDAISHDELKQVLQETGINESIQYVESETIELQQLIDFHYLCYEKGFTKAAITGHPIQAQLEQLGIAAYRMFPKENSVDSVINEIRRMIEMLQFKKAQIAVQIIEYDAALVGLPNTAFTTDKLYEIELEFTKKLRTYTKKVQGSILTIGPGRYAIFSTRGFLQDITHNFTRKAEIDSSIGLKEESKTCGIGIGHSAYEAEINAWNALLQSREWGKGSWAVCFDDKRITGPLGKEEQLTYSYISDEIHAIKEKTSLSVTTLHKLKSIMKKRLKEEISASELAQYMQITPRSARRILNELEENRLALVVAEESPRTTGRPRKVYKLLL